MRRDISLVRVVDVHRIRVERGKRADHAGEHRHRMRVAAEPAHEELHLLVHHRVMRHDADEILLLHRVGQLAVEQQVAHLEKVVCDSELLDRIAAIQELAFVAVDVRDRRVARGGRQKPRIVGELAGLPVQASDVDHVRSDRAREDRKRDGRGAVGEGKCRSAVGHRTSFQTVSDRGAADGAPPEPLVVLDGTSTARVIRAPAGAPMGRQARRVRR